MLLIMHPNEEKGIDGIKAQNNMWQVYKISEIAVGIVTMLVL